jgi:hypothetical protein
VIRIKMNKSRTMFSLCWVVCMWFLVLFVAVVVSGDVTSTLPISERVVESRKTSARALRTYMKKKEIKQRQRALAVEKGLSPLPIEMPLLSDSLKNPSSKITVIDFVQRRASAPSKHVARDLGLREQRGRRRKRMFHEEGGKGMGKGKGEEIGGKGTTKSKNSTIGMMSGRGKGKGKGGEIGGKETTKSKNSSKGMMSGRGQGKGKGEEIGGKGTTKSKNSSKGMMSGKGKGKGKGKGSKDISKICKGLDFGDTSGGKGKGKGKGMGKGKGQNHEGYGDEGKGSSKSKKQGNGKGKGKGGHIFSYGDDDRRHLTNDRALQFEGELCDTNTFEVARMNPDLSIFVDLIEHANLDEIFLCAGPFTVLAPSNAAFNKNPELLQSLFNPRNIEAVQELLLYHIVPGFYLSDEFVTGPLQTLLGEDVAVSLDPLLFNNAGVIMPDILACNGVIQIIDDLLIPPGA